MFRIVNLTIEPTFEELYENVPDGVIPVYGMDYLELTDWLERRVLGVTFLGADDEGRLHNAPVVLPLHDTAHYPPTAVFTVVHEFGHVLGLDHDPCKESVMYYSDYPGAYKVLRILQEDVRLLRELYAPDDVKDSNFELEIPRYGDWWNLD